MHSNILKSERCYSQYRTPQYKKRALEEIKKIARNRGGKCLSETYINSTTKLIFQCHKGHIWQTMPCSVKSSQSWCPTCRYEKKIRTLADLQKIAARHGGKCLATEYVSMNEKIEWQCAQGHIWEAAACRVQLGTWCRQCANDRLRSTIEQMHELAHSKGGKCLSTHYTNSMTNLLWECKLGHTWYATPGHVKDSTWCPLCFYLSQCRHDRSRRKYLPEKRKTLKA